MIEKLWRQISNHDVGTCFDGSGADTKNIGGGRFKLSIGHEQIRRTSNIMGGV